MRDARIDARRALAGRRLAGRRLAGGLLAWGLLAGGVLADAVPAAAAASAAPAADEFTQHAAHEHGRATLDLAVDGGTVTMRLAAPAMDIVGFEHAPRTAAERGAAESASTVLKLHKALFAFPVAARCTSTAAKVTPPKWESRGDGHDRDHAGHAGHEEHADYVAEWTFSCASPGALAFVDVRIPERFRKDLVVVANVITDALQTRQELRAGAVRVKLK